MICIDYDKPYDLAIPLPIGSPNHSLVILLWLDSMVGYFADYNVYSSLNIIKDEHNRAVKLSVSKGGCWHYCYNNSIMPPFSFSKDLNLKINEFVAQREIENLLKVD